jgi:hypothetical protein
MIDRPYPVTGFGTPLTRRSTWREADGSSRDRGGPGGSDPRAYSHPAAFG